MLLYVHRDRTDYVLGIVKTIIIDVLGRWRVRGGRGLRGSKHDHHAYCLNILNKDSDIFYRRKKKKKKVNE